MKIPSIFKSKHHRQTWPSCNHPNTNSFRSPTDGAEIFKTVNSVFDSGVETPNSIFTNSSETTSFSTESDQFDGESLELVVRNVRSERLFYEPDDTSSILGKGKLHGGGIPMEESVVISMESEDPYGDFRRSIEEMVECHGIKDWDCLEELLGWYLKVNGKKNHGFIVEAFVDVLVGIAECSTASSSSSSSSSNSTATFSTALSSFSFSSVNGGGGKHHEIQEDKKLILSLT